MLRKFILVIVMVSALFVSGSQEARAGASCWVGAFNLICFGGSAPCTAGKSCSWVSVITSGGATIRVCRCS